MDIASLSSHILPQSFYNRDTIVVAKDLLGKYFMRKLGSDTLVGKIVETEAYLPFDDPASHNFKGKTKRNETLFGEAGRLYVHQIRHYFCMDAVTEGENIPGSVLIRAVEPIDGIQVMKKLRNTEDIYNLCSGPSKTCMAFGITLAQNGMDLTNPNCDIFIAQSGDTSHIEIIESQRIGITKNTEPLLRFYITANRFISNV